MSDLILGFHPTGWQALAQSVAHLALLLTSLYVIASIWEFHKQGMQRVKNYDLRQENNK